ncbi:MAG: DMT family transporter, partial [Candidatus Methylomirabilis sp.]
IKALGAGACTLSLAVITGQSLPRPSILMATLVPGLISYGVSLVLDTYALRLLGAAREAGYFATAPFKGAVAALLILGEPWGSQASIATVLMAGGVFLLLREHHAHEHTHEELEHDHAHRHEDHHQHEHGAQDHVGESHAHLHWHLPLAHDHPHVSEAHHRHGHG